MSGLMVLGILAFVGVALGVGAFNVLHWFNTRTAGTLQFVRKTFMTPNEVEFFHRIRKALGPGYQLMAQVSMAALIDTKLKPTHPVYWKVRQSYSGRICDFVVCDGRTMVPLLVIELDDVMHDFDRDKKRDNFLALAGVQTIRFWSRNKPTVEELQGKLSAMLPKKNLAA